MMTDTMTVYLTGKRLAQEANMPADQSACVAMAHLMDYAAGIARHMGVTQDEYEPMLKAASDDLDQWLKSMTDGGPDDLIYTNALLLATCKVLVSSMRAGPPAGVSV